MVKTSVLRLRLKMPLGMKRFGEVYFSLNVYSNNTTAVKLYQKLGFNPKSAPSDSVGDEEAVYMILIPV
jgi:ribosomal protein S18 acetylase RimI-like enzyme